MHQEVFRTTLAGQERTYGRAPTFPDLSEAAEAREDAALSRIAHPRARDRRRRAGGKGELPDIAAAAPRPARKNPAPARRSTGRPDDDEGMTHPQVRPDPALGLLELYDDALPHVYGYLLARCGDTGLAEDLTAESFLAAVHAVRKPGAPGPSVPWLIGVARHKLADHWRRVEREQRGLRLLDGEQALVDDPWDTAVDRIRAREVLGQLGPHHRAALTLALPRRAAGTRGGQAPGPHRARHRGAAGAGPRRVPPDLRGRGGLAMTDPFEALREPVTPADPDPGFAGRLRQRLTREVFASPRRNHAPADRHAPGRARARLAAGADPLHRGVRRPARHGLVHRGIRRAAPRRAHRQRGRHDRPRRGRPRRRGADVLRGVRPVAQRARARARLPRDVQPQPPPGRR